MSIVCPPKNDPAFKKLSDALGENKAYVAFFRHGNDIPDLETSRAHLANRPAGYKGSGLAAAPIAPQTGPIEQETPSIAPVSAPIEPAEVPIAQQPMQGEQSQARLAEIDSAIEDLDKREAKLGPFKKNARVTLADERRALLEERLQRQAELGSPEAEDALMKHHEATNDFNESGIDVDGQIRRYAVEHPLMTPAEAKKQGITMRGELQRFYESLPKRAQIQIFRKGGSADFDRFSAGVASFEGEEEAHGETSGFDRVLKAFQAPKKLAPMPPKIETRLPIAKSAPPLAHVVRSEPFGYGAVVEGSPSIDFRAVEGAEGHGPEEWVSEVDRSFRQAQKGTKAGNRADSRVALALQGPDGRVHLRGVTRPDQVVRVGRVARGIKELAVQDMGSNRAGERIVDPNGKVPAALHDIVEAGLKPLAVIHFDGEPTKIRKTYDNAADFDAAWHASEKTAITQKGDDKPPERLGVVDVARRGEQEIQQQIDDIGRAYEKASPDEQEEMKGRLDTLFQELHDVTSTNQNQTGDAEVPFRTLKETEHLMPVSASRASEFGAVVSRLKNQGGRVDLFAKEMMAQGSGKIIQGQIDSLKAKLATAEGPAKSALKEQIAYREQRIKDLSEAAGVTFNPWHIAVAMNNVQRADVGDLVTLLHEAAEKSSLHLNMTMRGAISRAVEESIGDLRARAAAASQETGVPVARETGAMDLLSEALGQKLAAAGIPDHPTVVGQIMRWVKDLYYRVTMAAQAAFGHQPDPKLALDWFENQMNRLVLGDYDHRIGRILDRYITEPAVQLSRRFSGASGTPGGMVDYIDPIDQNARQPSFEPTSEDALKWNIAFRTTAPNPGEELEIPDPEARGRIDAAALNHLIEFGEGLRGTIAPDVEWGQFWRTVGRGQDPKELIIEQEKRFPGAKDAKIGGEKMTQVMNDLANLKARTLLEKFHMRAIRESARSREAAEESAGKAADLAQKTNKIEGDFRNAAMHDDFLKLSMKDLVQDLVRDYSRGLDTAGSHGELARAVRESEGLLESDPIPARFQEVFKRLSDGGISIFGYIKEISNLDLDLANMSNREVMEAIRANAPDTPVLEELSKNRPLAVALTVLARKNAGQVDQIQLGWLKNMEKFHAIQSDLKEIRDATQAKLRSMLSEVNERVKAKGLRERLKVSYLQVRGELRGAQARLDTLSAKSELLDRAIPHLAAKVKDLQVEGAGAMSEWTPRDGSEWTTMTLNADGGWAKGTKVLRFNPDGSAVDSAGIRSAIAENMEWLARHQKEAGGQFFERVKRQTTELAHLDVQRKYQAGHMFWLDRWVAPVADEAAALGGAGARVKQMMLRFQHINYVNQSDLDVLSHQWTKSLADVEKSAGIEDHGQFFSQIYNPAMYFLGTNPGLEEGPAIRRATQIARARLLKAPAEDFNDKFGSFLRATKAANDKLEGIATKEGAYVKDPRLSSELRRAVARGWLTGMRGMDGGVVSTILDEMGRAGWRNEIKEETAAGGKKVARPVRAVTFDHLTVQDVTEKQSDALGKALGSYFTPGIKSRWLEPFINKGGVEILRHGDEPIPQAELQSAWATSGADVLKWIDGLAAKRGVESGEKGEGLDEDGEKQEPKDALAEFRLSVLRQLNGLFGMESKLAHETSQTRSMFDPQGPKPHVIMDARQNDLLPPEHLRFATYDPTSAKMMLGQVAFHAAFGRNGERAISAVDELKGAISLRHQEYQALRGTSRSARVAEAAARGWKYKELETAARKYNDVLSMQQHLEGIFGVNNPAGPFNDMRTGMEVLHAMSGQIVDNPKVGLYHVISLLERPFAMHSLGPAAIKASAGAMKDFLKTGVGSMLESMNLHLLHSAEWAKEVGAVQGSSMRNQPWSVVLSDIGQRGRFQNSFSDKYLIRPLRMLRYIQQKGIRVGPGEGAREFPRFAAIPGMGVLNTIMQTASTANTGAQVRMMETMVAKGIRYFSTHREDYENPAFRFKPEHVVSKWDRGVFDYFRNKTVEYGMGNLEDIVRQAMPAATKGERLINKDQVLRLSMMASNELDGATSVNTTPGVLQSTPILRYAMPLLRWPLWKMHQAHEGMKTADGRYNMVGVAKGLGTLAMWNLPMGLAFSFMMDRYDEKLLHKKSNLPPLDATAAVPIVGPLLNLATSDRTIPQNLVAMLERGAKAGNIYGLGADLAATFGAPLDPGSGQRTFSLDQRVLVMSQLLNLKQAVGNLIDQGGDMTWSSFGKPFVASLGGNGALQAVDLVNNALGLDNQESRLVRRINASSWLRSAGEESGVELRGAGAAGENPTPMTVWVREMQLAAMAGDRLGFLDAHRKALEAARRQVSDDPRVAIEAREKEASARVLSSWKSRDPLDVFRFRPTTAQMAGIYANMDSQGQEDVKQALARYYQFTSLISPTDFERKEERQLTAFERPPGYISARRRQTGLLYSSP